MSMMSPCIRTGRVYLPLEGVILAFLKFNIVISIVATAYPVVLMVQGFNMTS